MFRPSADHMHVRTIVDAFSALPVGGSITFEEMAQLIGFDPRAEGRGYIIQAAITKANKETGRVMSNIRSVGYQCLTQEQYAAAIASRRGRGRRLFVRTHRIFSRAVRASNETMEPAEMIKIGRELAMVGLLAHMAQDRVAAKIELSEKTPSYTETIRRTLEAMNGK